MSFLDDALARGREGKQHAIKKEIEKCQELCSKYKPKIAYMELNKKTISKQIY